jgi:hypothetical protein
VAYVTNGEQEQYYATVKALKIDLTMLHGAERTPSGFLNGKNIDIWLMSVTWTHLWAV